MYYQLDIERVKKMDWRMSNLSFRVIRVSFISGAF